MRFSKPFYSNICKLLAKLLLVVICSNILVCCVSKQTKENLTAQNQSSVTESAININTATAQELEKLPHVGTVRAQKIIEYRERFGVFHKPEHLLLVDGISDANFREMRNFVRVE